MDLYLQMGYGMKNHAIELIKKWQGGTVILSPKNITLEQMKKTAKELNKINGQVLFDPQFYMPRISQKNLQKHLYWPDNYSKSTFFNGPGIKNMIDILLNEYIYPLHTSGFIIPTLFLSDINNTWNTVTENIIAEVERKQISIPKFLTLCLGTKLLEKEESIHLLLEELEDYPVDGFYIIPEHPNKKYLVDNESWLLNLLDFAAGLKLLNKKVILGYANHQFLFMALAKVDALCSGIWLKTRVFPIEEFRNEEEGTARRSVWYYCPQALSEYQIPSLDLAQIAGLLERLKTPDEFESNYADPLFTGVQPTIVNWVEREAFRHYLNCLKKQCIDVSKDSYENTRDYLKLLFETAQELSDLFRQNGIRAKHRDFGNVAENNLAVLDAFDNIRGLVFSANWNNL
jgi:hypothetical protein